MAYYIVKTTSIATDNNHNFKGETRTYFTGKGGWSAHKITDGWKRKHFAERYIKKCKEWDASDRDVKKWKNTYEIIEI